MWLAGNPDSVEDRGDFAGAYSTETRTATNNRYLVAVRNVPRGKDNNSEFSEIASRMLGTAIAEHRGTTR